MSICFVEQRISHFDPQFPKPEFIVLLLGVHLHLHLLGPWNTRNQFGASVDSSSSGNPPDLHCFDPAMAWSGGGHNHRTSKRFGLFRPKTCQRQVAYGAWPGHDGEVRPFCKPQSSGTNPANFWMCVEEDTNVATSVCMSCQTMHIPHHIRSLHLQSCGTESEGEISDDSALL